MVVEGACSGASDAGASENSASDPRLLATGSDFIEGPSGAGVACGLSAFLAGGGLDCLELANALVIGLGGHCRPGSCRTTPQTTFLHAPRTPDDFAGGD